MTTIDTSFDQAERQRLNDLMKVADRAGLIRIPAVIEAKIDNLDKAMAAKRLADQVVVDIKDRYGDALSAAEFAVSAAVVKEGNKTFIVTGDDRRPVTAEEARVWVTGEAKKDDDVRDLGSQLRAAELAATEARDAVTVCEARLKGAEHALRASCVVGELLKTTFEAAHGR